MRGSIISEKDGKTIEKGFHVHGAVPEIIDVLGGLFPELPVQLGPAVSIFQINLLLSLVVAVFRAGRNQLSAVVLS